MRRTWAATPILFICFACTDQDLLKVAKGLDAVAVSVGQFQTTVIEANTQHLLSESVTRKLLTIALKVDQGGKEATQVVKQLQQLAPADRVKIMAILAPVIKAVSDSVNNDLIPITDPEAKQKVQLALLAVQSGLNTVNLILAGGA